MKSNCQEYDDDNDLFPELMTGEEGVLLDVDNLISPWNRPFAELIPSMVDIGQHIYKKIIKKPVDDIEIQGRCRVTIAYNAYWENENASFDSSFLRGDYKTFVIGDCEVLNGLELAVQSMKRREESQFIIPYDLLFGKLGCEPRIKKEADALFVIQLIKFSEIGDEEAAENVQPEDRTKYGVMIEKIKEVKASGLDYFRNGAYVKAAACFHRAINKLEMCQLKDEEEEKDCEQHLIKLYVNAMTCYNKLNKPKQACSAFKDLTRLDGSSKNAKALYQHGKALMALGEFARAKGALTKANRLLPNDSEIAKLLKELDTKHSEHKTTESKMWRRAFGNDEPTATQNVLEVSDSFKTVVNEMVTKLKNDPNSYRENVPKYLSKDEEAYIRDLAKQFQMRLVISDMQGHQSCYLTKDRNL